jgi:hypothetical protein
LSKEQQAQLPALLEQGAEAFGFRGQVWTTARVAQMIQQQFGVKYHPAHCSLLLRKLKWSQQKPIEKATQRDEAAIRTWKEYGFDEVKKKAKAEGRTMVFVDESSFYLLPMVVHTYAPRGQTPIVRVPLSYDHLSAIGGITPEGRIFMQRQDHSYKGPDVVRFVTVAPARDCGEHPGDLGWSVHSPLSGGQKFHVEARCQAHSSGAPACLCTRIRIPRKVFGISSSESN